MWDLAASWPEGAVEDARRLFLSGERTQALERLKFERLSPMRIALEAQILYWSRRRHDASELVLNAMEASDSELWKPDGLLALVLAVRAASLASIGEHEEARTCLADIADLDHTEDVARFYAALASWSLKDYVRSSSLLEAISSSDENLRAYVFVLRGWLAASAGDIDLQIRHCGEALASLDRATFPDLNARAMALRALATLARDRMDASALANVLKQSETPWTRDLILEHFQVKRMTAWARAMAGEYIRAGEDLNEARRLANSPYLRMIAHLDRAWLATISNEDLHAAIELDEAYYNAERIDWASSSDEEIGAVLLAVELTAPFDAERAEALLRIADSISVSSSSGFAHDQRLRGFALSARSAIQRARNRTLSAVTQAREAIDIFSAFGYRWRVADLALRLHAMTGDVSWLTVVEEAASAYPRSFIAVAFGRLTTAGRTPIEMLTQRQRQIVELIRSEGLGNDAIAERLDLSPNTIRIHKRKIYRVFRVSNEFQLLAKLNAAAS